MKEKPILFNTEMVKAVLADRKTQTRRVIKNACDIIQDWDDKDKSYGPYYEDQYGDFHKSIEACPYGQIGSVLWVRETFAFYGDDIQGVVHYKATHQCEGSGWKPSIFMPKKYCRIWLEIIDIRVERVQDIGEKDAESEGIQFLRNAPDVDEALSAKQLFECLWDSINEKRGYSWESNPWVWTVEFKRIDK